MDAMAKLTKGIFEIVEQLKEIKKQNAEILKVMKKIDKRYLYKDEEE